ncbi:D-sedoheptulose 7-phosphate isomerase [Pseudobutyrivibrio sp. YE44]|uniref:SIS domain-containing protein n=1 Tax=Pseudobutyrivibrio sp. YE44 TaxID=1520802 RepID=UPI000889C7F7|nr:SIS domain-containing protein [Pseudobutyrivibrio sp. YE44]SDB29059.1 D-sedoheptulose 7-phosphate isomerase [Pseudobutyrivibrio sp. YE44]
MTDYKAQIKQYIDMEKQVLDNLDGEEINEVMNVLENARLKGKRVFICGNGGSASTAAHLECDFNKGISYDQTVKYDIECLSDNVPMLMAIANDIGYDDIFVVPLRNKLKLGDIVIGISGSGNSTNVIKAFEYANSIGADTIALTGYSGGKLKEISKYNIHVNIDNMQIVEDIHLVLNHMMMFILSGMKGC